MDKDCLIAFGSNVGDRLENFQGISQALFNNSRIKKYKSSRCIETAPIGGEVDQKNFLNAVIRFSTNLSAESLCQMLFELEIQFGRTRGKRWESRTVDLDLLLFGTDVIVSPTLCIPHPRMSFRRFVLEPAAQIASNMMHPTSGLTVGQLLTHLNRMPNRLLVVGCEANVFAMIGQGMKTDLTMIDAQTEDVGNSETDLAGSTCYEVVIARTVSEFQRWQHHAKLVVIVLTRQPQDHLLSTLASSTAGSVELNRVGWAELIQLATRFAGPTVTVSDDELACAELDAAVAAMGHC